MIPGFTNLTILLNKFLFVKQKEYFLTEDIETAYSKIVEIAGTKWSDFSENIDGESGPDHSFKLYQKWSFVQIGWFERRPSYISGTISNEKNATKITTTIRPNSMFVLLFYFLLR